MCTAAEKASVLIRVDEIWLATEPLGMRAGHDTALARIVKVFSLCLPVHQLPRQPYEGADSRWPRQLI